MATHSALVSLVWLKDILFVWYNDNDNDNNKTNQKMQQGKEKQRVRVKQARPRIVKRMETWLLEWFGSKEVVKVIGFEDMLSLLRSNVVLLNTMARGDQACLIRGTLHADDEESAMNAMLTSTDPLVTDRWVVVYGRHTLDPKPMEKARTLRLMGLSRLLVYRGGLFEWLLLQEVFGQDQFPTQGACPDLLAYRPSPTLR